MKGLILKKKTIFIFALLVVSLFSLFLCSCGEHTHEYTAEVLAEETCENDGIVVYRCICGDYYIENIDKLGHDMVHHEAGEDGCEKWEAYEACSRCDKTTQQIVSNHSYTHYAAKTPDCYSVGWKAYNVCTKCGYSTKKEIPIKHGDMTEVPALAPTCETAGYTAHHRCSICGATPDKTVINALGHVLTNYIKKDSTCYSSGRTACVACSREGCGYTTRTEIQPTQHDLVHHQAKAPTCEEVGWEAYDECKNCIYTTYKEIPALGHSYADTTSSLKSCSRCHAQEETLTILKNRVTDYKLLYNVLDTKLLSVVKWVNSELKKTVGWEFPISTITPSIYSDDNTYICFGNNVYSSSAGCTYTSVQGTDYKIQVKGKNIFVLGDQYALQYGVYGLLKTLINYEKYNIYEKNLGEQISFDNNDDIILTVSQIEETHIKDIAYAQGFSSGNLYSNNLGASDQNLASMGFTYGSVLSHGYAENDDGETPKLQYNVRSEHNSLGYYPTAVYLDSHPEWYAHSTNAKGENVYSSSPKQVCYYELAQSAEAIQRAVTVFEFCHNKSGWDSLSISNMDTGGHCSCSHCKNNLGYQYINFLNKLSDALKLNENTKNMKVEGMIYSANCLNVPLDENGEALIHTKDDVSLRFAFNYADYYAGFSEIDVALLTKWSKVCNKWEYWTYNTRTSYSLFFFDNFTNMQREYQILSEFGATAVADEGYKGSNSFTNFNNLRYYLIEKLTENINCNYQYEINKYFDNYFGVASSVMKLVFDKQCYLAQYQHDNWAELFNEGYRTVPRNSDSIAIYNSIGNVNIGTYSSWAMHYYATNKTHGNRLIVSLSYDREDFRELYSYINQAKALVNASTLTTAEKERYISRIELEEVGILYQFLFTYSDRFTVDNISFSSSLTADDLSAIGVSDEVEARNKYYTLASKFGINSIGYISLSELQTIWANEG